MSQLPSNDDWNEMDHSLTTSTGGFLSDEARKRLFAAGWTQSHEFDSKDIERMIIQNGCHAGRKAMMFLQHFGNITFGFPHFRVRGSEDRCTISANWIEIVRKWPSVADFEAVVGSRFTVVGTICTDHMILSMDDNGNVYGSFEDLLFRFGSSGVDAINNICAGLEGVKIECPPLVIPTADPSIQLTDAALLCLNQSGWRGGPKMVSVPGNADVATAFLTEFDGVALRYHTFGKDVVDHFLVVPDISVQQRALVQWTALVGQNLRPIGRQEKSGCVVLMAEDGRVFSGMEEAPDVFHFLGRSGIDAINRFAVGDLAIRIR